MVFYRKYRPQLISDLDSESVRSSLQAIFTVKPGESRIAGIPHAFLFTGPKGLGKTSAARIVAKAVNCEDKSKVKSQKLKAQVKSQKLNEEKVDGIEPCNECSQCVSIREGNNLDVVEIDAASNRGIDEIRDLREKIWLAPVKAGRKVYIIDEVHMLTSEAFNALLKIVEEPPHHSMFVLCTTESHKVPDTIVSRCFQIVFQRAGIDEIVNSLGRIVKGEGMEIDNESLIVIARMADGGFRDAAKMLEEISLSAHGGKITKDFIEAKYNTSNVNTLVAEMFAALLKRDTKSALKIVESMSRQGTDTRFFVRQAIEYLHERLLDAAGVKGYRSSFMVQNDVSGAKALEPDLLTIGSLYRVFSKAYSEIKDAVVPQLPLELAIIEYYEQSVQDVEIGELDQSGESKANSASTMEAFRKKSNAALKQRALNGEVNISKGKGAIRGSGGSAAQVNKSDVDLLKMPANGEVTNEWLSYLWREVIVEMKKYNHTTSGVLRSCKLEKYDKKTLVISTIYKFHKERLDEPRARDALMRVCKALTGNDVGIEVELKKM